MLTDIAWEGPEWINPAQGLGQVARSCRRCNEL